MRLYNYGARDKDTHLPFHRSGTNLGVVIFTQCPLHRRFKLKKKDTNFSGTNFILFFLQIKLLNIVLKWFSYFLNKLYLYFYGVNLFV